MADNLNALPLDSGDRTAASHKDWLDELIAQFNTLNAESACNIITFSPTGGTGYYRIGQSANQLAVRLRIVAAWNGKVSDLELVAGGNTSAGTCSMHRQALGPGGSLFSILRISSDGSDVFLDLNVADVTGAGTITILAYHEGHFTPAAVVDYNPTVGATYNSALTVSTAYSYRTSGAIYVLQAIASGSSVLAPYFDAGSAGTTRGVHYARRGSGTNSPGTYHAQSRSGSDYYRFYDDNGYSRRHTSLPTADTDGRPDRLLAAVFTSGGALLPAANPATKTQREIGASNKLLVPVLQFDKDTDQYAWFGFTMPDDWNGSGTFSFDWTAASGTPTNAVKWGVAGVCVADGGTLDVALGTEATVTDAFQGADKRHRCDVALTIGSQAAGRWCSLRLHRLASDGADTFDAAAEFMGGLLQY